MSLPTPIKPLKRPRIGLYSMKICDSLGAGGSFSEAEGKPILRGMGLYHGKQGTGVSVEAKVRSGPITTLNATQTGDGKLKLISSEGESTNGPIMQIGNTQTPVRFRGHPDDYTAQWFAEAPTHHCALSIGHNASLFQKAGELLLIMHVTL